MFKPGFTLLETLFALAIVALMLPALYTLQTSLLRNMVTARQEYDRLCAALFMWQEEQAKKDFIQEHAVDDTKKEMQKTITQKLPDSQGEVFIEMIAPNAKSALAPFKGVMLERMTVSWKGITGKPLSETLVGLRYDPVKEEK